jgi:hypothetical protein
MTHPEGSRDQVATHRAHGLAWPQVLPARAHVRTRHGGSVRGAVPMHLPGLVLGLLGPRTRLTRYLGPRALIRRLAWCSPCRALTYSLA